MVTTIFWGIWGTLILERMVELIMSQRHAKQLLSNGYVEHGAGHYPLIVLLHTCFYLVLGLHAILMPLASLSLFWLAVFCIAQLGRFWVLRTLGPRFTTRIYARPDEQLIKSGPYRWFRHPNYVVVELEFISIPLIFGMSAEALIFGGLNAIVLFLVRIPAESKAWTDVS